MSLIGLTLIVFVTIALAAFLLGAAVVSPSSVLGARLRALGSQQQPVQERQPLKERVERALDPITKAIPLSPADVSRTRGWMIQAGLREPRHASYYFGARMLFALIGFVGVA